MSIAQKLATGLVFMGVATTLILPGRQTVPVINAAGSFLRGMFATAMGTGKQV